MNTKPNHILTKQVEELGLKGVPDVKIAKDLGIVYGTVVGITTKLWKRKMQEKDLKKISE